MDYKNIGLRIKHFRQIQGITQKALADKIGTTWEMVSRYETGKSSPLSRIDAIAQTLGISVTRLLAGEVVAEETATYSRNLIPLLNEKFANLTEAINRAKTYYSAPDWIIQKYARPFAIESDLLKINTTQVEKNGILFATQEFPQSSNDLVLSLKDKALTLTTYSRLAKNEKPLATVIAWEKRFV